MSWIAVVFRIEDSLQFFWTKRLFKCYELVENDFRERERDAFYSPTPIAIRIHIYNNFLSSPEENPYSPVRIASVILAFTGFLVSRCKERLYFYKYCECAGRSFGHWKQDSQWRKIWDSTVIQVCFKHLLKGVKFTLISMLNIKTIYSNV